MILRKSAREKGKRGERELALWMEQMSGCKYRRVPMSGALHGSWDGDVAKIGQEPSVFDGILPEAKNTKSLSVKEWLKQCNKAVADANMNKFFIYFLVQGEPYFILNRRYMEKLVKQKNAQY